MNRAAWAIAWVTSVAASAVAQTTERQSVGAGGALSLGNSQYGSMSRDGRWVTFESEAPNIVPGDANGVADVFVRDRASGTIELVSLAADGGPATSACLFPTISDDGRRVAFSTVAALVADDTNGAYDLYVRDRVAGTTVRASVGAGGAQGEGGLAFRGAISGDGRFAAFPSTFTNLVPGDTNGQRDIFVRDLELGTTERVSLASDGTQGDGPSFFVEISADGRFVAFDGESTNLVPGDTNATIDVFVRDRLTITTSRVSVSSTGAQGDGNLGSISADGRFVTFDSGADTLVPLDIPGTHDVFVHDLATGSTRLVPRPPGIVGTYGGCVSDHGTWVAFFADEHVWLCELSSGISTPVSVRADGRDAAYTSQALRVSDDGEVVLFASNSDELDAGDTALYPDMFVRTPAASIRAVCFGDGASGACPCSNPSVLTDHEGCAWTLSGGAALVASGDPSVASDTIVLTARGLSASSALVFQGSAFASPAIAFGDGLRCASGMLTRLASRAPSNGALAFPSATDMPLSQLGHASVGSTLTYQLAFRTPGSFCSESAFATTNAIVVAWH